MRKVLYSVVMSLDSYIAGPAGGYDWIPEESEIDWDAFLDRFDTVLMGRDTWAVVAEQEGAVPTSGMRTIVFSTTLAADQYPEVEVVSEDAADKVAELKAEDGKDIWLMGGGRLFRSLLHARVVDRVEVAIAPILLGEGIPLLPSGGGGACLELMGIEEFPASGLVVLSYDVAQS